MFYYISYLHIYRYFLSDQVLTDLLTDLRNKEGNESAAVILRHILCIYNKESIKNS